MNPPDQGHGSLKQNAGFWVVVGLLCTVVVTVIVVLGARAVNKYRKNRIQRDRDQQSPVTLSGSTQNGTENGALTDGSDQTLHGTEAQQAQAQAQHQPGNDQAAQSEPIATQNRAIPSPDGSDASGFFGPMSLDSTRQQQNTQADSTEEDGYAMVRLGYQSKFTTSDQKDPKRAQERGVMYGREQQQGGGNRSREYRVEVSVVQSRVVYC